MKKAAKKVVLVTGGNRGIGAAIVERFATGDWITAACASSSKSRWDSEPDFKAVCDVTRSQQVLELVEQVRSRFGRLDCLVNNAGLSGSNPLGPNDSDELWYRIIDVNLHGTYLVSKAAMPLLKMAGVGGASIVNISSVLGLTGVPDATAYCAAKHGVIGFTRSLSHHLAPKGVTVNAICPGWTRTEMALERMKEVGMSEDDAAKSLPIGRIVEPREIAEACWFFASENARAITGQALTIDSGFLA